MRTFLLPAALAGSLVLGGCSVTAIDTSIRAQIGRVCTVLEAAHDTYLELLPIVNIEQRYKDLIAAAYDPAHDTCLHKETVTALDIVVKVSTAGVKIYAILSQVQKANPAAAAEVLE